MKLRDGSCYSPFQSQHMILRCGKAVQSFQASIFNNLKHVPFLWNQNYSSSLPANNDEVCHFSSGYGDFPPEKIKQHHPLNHVRSQKLSAPAFKSQSETRQPDSFIERWIGHFPKVTQSDEIFDADGGGRRRAMKNIPLRGCAKRCAQVMKLSSPLAVDEEQHHRYYSFVNSVYGFRTVYKALNIIIVLFPIVLAVILLTESHIKSTRENDITDLNLPNTVQMTIPAEKQNIKFWHVAPSFKQYKEQTAIENLNDGQPIIIHLRDDEDGNVFHRLNVFKALSDSGFHVLVPVQPLQKLDFVTMWSAVKNTVTGKNQKAMYIWSDMRLVGDTKEYVDILTKMALFPKGVVIEKEMRDQIDAVRNLEIWRGGMYTTEKYFWNYLKCPLTMPINGYVKFLNEEVSLCVSAITFSPDFTVRY